MTLTCPHCGQRVLLRLGVHLSPRRADVFDAIARQSKYGGIQGRALSAMFGGVRCVRVHISDINKLVRAKGWEIVCEREGCARGFYRLRRRQHERPTIRSVRSATRRTQHRPGYQPCSGRADAEHSQARSAAGAVRARALPERAHGF
jgi:hypothetical protein